MSKKNTSKIYGPKKSGKKMTLNNSQTYVIGFYDMGMFDELQIMAHDKDEAREIFLFNYTVKKEEPYIARCETLKEVEERIKSGNAALPMDWQLPRFEDFSNKYYEALRK
jgi:hypothetical protein